MTQEEKELLLKDLCARLPYEVIVQQSPKYVDKHFADKWDTEPHDFKIIGVEGTNNLITDKRKEERTYAKGIVSSPITICIHNGFTGQVVKPYLRPMSSMTEEEYKELSKLLNYEFYADEDFALCAEDDRHRIRLDLMKVYIDFLISHHFDYRGLIEKGLALESLEGMYK